jgi:hypothetical protein
MDSGRIGSRDATIAVKNSFTVSASSFTVSACDTPVELLCGALVEGVRAYVERADVTADDVFAVMSENLDDASRVVASGRA